MTEDEPVYDNSNGGYRVGSGQPAKAKQQKSEIASLFDSDAGPSTDDGMEWREQNRKIVENWTTPDKITTILNNLASMEKNAGAQRTLLEFTLGKAVAASESKDVTPQSAQQLGAHVDAMFATMRENLIESGIEPEFVDKMMEQALWGSDGVEEVEADGDEEVFGEAL